MELEPTHTSMRHRAQFSWGHALGCFGFNLKLLGKRIYDIGFKKTTQNGIFLILFAMVLWCAHGQMLLAKDFRLKPEHPCMAPKKTELYGACSYVWV
jgi:hypothetical protein